MIYSARIETVGAARLLSLNSEVPGSESRVFITPPRALGVTTVRCCGQQRRSGPSR